MTFVLHSVLLLLLLPVVVPLRFLGLCTWRIMRLRSRVCVSVCRFSLAVIIIHSRLWALIKFQ